VPVGRGVERSGRADVEKAVELIDSSVNT